MNTKQIDLIRFNKTLLSVLLLSVLLYLGRAFLILVAIATFLAMLLFPMVQRLQWYKLKEPAAILLLLALLVLLGALLWGVPGMILFVPLFASLKVILDRVPRLSPYGYILGKEEENV